ncbi:MAG: alpha/beta hydrolase [Deltaproteobacteria bacterium]|nr:alpha/beta hydrolase [Deltaproteobacteria bacterium]
MSWIGIVAAIALVIALLVLACWCWYRAWLRRVTRLASAESQIVSTARGRVEYAVRGNGPVVLHFHGGNVGHNGGFFLAHLVDAGYRVLTPDRPGYLGTPIENGRTPEEQADLAAALLDTLGIERVAVVGISAGGPSAIQFAARHAQRTEALVLLSAISQRTGLSTDQTNSSFGRLVMTPKYQNPAYFLIHQSMHHMTKLAMRDMIKTETTYDEATGRKLIDAIVSDPDQKRRVLLIADAMVPALPRFAGVMNDLQVQKELGELPLAAVRAPTLIVGSRFDGDIGYANSLHSHEKIAGSTLITVDQFGHFIWWGDAAVTRDFEARIEQFLDRSVRRASTRTGGAAPGEAPIPPR